MIVQDVLPVDDALLLAPPGIDLLELGDQLGVLLGEVVGLDAGGDVDLDDYRADTGVVVVVGSEGKGLSRLVRENCDSILSIPIASSVESLNASVAAGVTLSEFARQRRVANSK